jgi:hypothetical protein
MPSIEDFMDGVMAEFRGRLALLGDSKGGCLCIRGAIEDGIALLMGYRRSDMDVARFEMLLSTLRSRRFPDGLFVLRPERLAAELSRLLAVYQVEHGAIAHDVGLAHARHGARAGGGTSPRLLQPIN